MDPKIITQSITEEGNALRFTLSGVNVSIANAIRRTILSDIDTVVFKTYNESVNKCTITQNTTNFNNEIIKQRLGCVPIHIADMDIPLNNYLMELSVENMTDTIQYVTTQDFKIKNTTTNEYLSDNDRQKIFPPSEETGYYIDFLRLKPRITEDLLGDAIKLTCEFSLGNSKENGMFNVVSGCSYGYTIDEVKQEIELNKKRKEWKDQGLKPAEVKQECDNWKLLEGLRVYKKDSYDFMIESVGVFTNQEILHKSCDIILSHLEGIDTLIENSKLEITESNTTMKHSYDIMLHGHDYTIGKILEFMLYTKFYSNDGILSFCGFVKEHPHNDYSVIRLAYNDETNKESIQGHLKECIQDLVHLYKKIRSLV